MGLINSQSGLYLSPLTVLTEFQIVLFDGVATDLGDLATDRTPPIICVFHEKFSFDLH